ncbi:MAG: hypothetical protein JW779_03680 [Candidatus Thorarchaeota archaeon]|nr:hypothetical protein [Candidatus Thorarchaeota archaeon]
MAIGIIVSQEEASQHFKFLWSISPPQESPRKVIMTELNSEFKCCRPCNVIDDRCGGGLEQWELYFSDNEETHVPINVCFDSIKIYPALNTQCHYDWFPPDSYISGQAIGDAIKSSGKTDTRYVILHGNACRGSGGVDLVKHEFDNARIFDVVIIACQDWPPIIKSQGDQRETEQQMDLQDRVIVLDLPGLTGEKYNHDHLGHLVSLPTRS